LATVFGQVTVERLAYRASGAANLYPADGVGNLPVEKHSHGVRRLAVVESVRGSFQDAAEAIGRVSGLSVGKRQVEGLAAAAAVDVAGFYAACRSPGPSAASDVLVLTCDGKGVVMRPDALRQATAKAAAAAAPKLATRLSRGEKRYRKRMAEVGCVYDVTPVVRTPADVIHTPGRSRAERTDRPKARGKWMTASLQREVSEVVADLFAEATRRDPRHERRWLALVDGNNTQIEAIHTEAATRGVDVSVIVDFVHVLEYVWKAAWCFFDEGNPAAEAWVAEQATRILAGHAGRVAAGIRRKAGSGGGAWRKNADTCADYLTAKQPYLDYATALAAGWPIATGVIEGACRYLVKDRMDITGARWGLHGAEAILTLRALVANGDLDDYWKYHLEQEKQRNHTSRYLNNTIPA
jgi:hypothetical protein